MKKLQKETEHDNALIFIPDISGFTNFVNNTEILHARHIITELLENIIDSNTLDLKVSEIEGDAVLFYRFGELPSVQEILSQTESMFIAFKAHLKKYNQQRICQCGACVSAGQLSLKIVAHYGEVVLERVKEHQKLFGTDVIIAHRLLKNDLANKQYVLFTDQLLTRGSAHEALTADSWTEPIKEHSDYDLGRIDFYYLPLDSLESKIPEPEVLDFSLPGVTQKVDEFEGVIEAPLDLVFNVVSDLGFRHHWMEALKDSDQLNSRITQNGSTHRCVINNNSSDPSFYSHDFKKSAGFVRFTESDPAKNISSVFSFEQTDQGHTNLRIDTFIKPNIIKEWLFNLFLKKNYAKQNIINYKNLNDYCKELVSKGEEHSSQIVL